MSLPIRTTLDDLDAVCGYLTTKPTGATLAEAKAVVDKKKLDGRKLSALKMWGLIEEVDGKLKITDRGRRSVKDAGAFRSDSLQGGGSRIGSPTRRWLRERHTVRRIASPQRIWLPTGTSTSKRTCLTPIGVSMIRQFAFFKLHRVLILARLSLDAKACPLALTLSPRRYAHSSTDLTKSRINLRPQVTRLKSMV